ncbi:MAG: response regulator [Bacteroidota bacterium]|jgi:two-component system response regulator LytT
MSTIKIGIIEDEMIIAATIEQTLQQLGYEVAKPASSFQLGLEMIEADQPDLLLVDINLGGQKDGIDLALHVREFHDLPLIFLTANSDPSTVNRAKVSKPDAYLVKPFNKEDLFTSIEIAISKHQQAHNSIRLHKFLLIKDGNKFHKVHTADILFLQSEDNYVSLHFSGDRKIICRSTMTEILERLPEPLFCRISRSHIVGVSHVSRFNTDWVWIGETSIPVKGNASLELAKKVSDFIG